MDGQAVLRNDVLSRFRQNEPQQLELPDQHAVNDDIEAQRGRDVDVIVKRIEAFCDCV